MKKTNTKGSNLPSTSTTKDSVSFDAITHHNHPAFLPCNPICPIYTLNPSQIQFPQNYHEQIYPDSPYFPEYPIGMYPHHASIQAQNPSMLNGFHEQLMPTGQSSEKRGDLTRERKGTKRTLRPNRFSGRREKRLARKRATNPVFFPETKRRCLTPSAFSQQRMDNIPDETAARAPSGAPSMPTNGQKRAAFGSCERSNEKQEFSKSKLFLKSGHDKNCVSRSKEMNVGAGSNSKQDEADDELDSSSEGSGFGSPEASGQWVGQSPVNYHFRDSAFPTDQSVPVVLSYGPFGYHAYVPYGYTIHPINVPISQGQDSERHYPQNRHYYRGRMRNPVEIDLGECKVAAPESLDAETTSESKRMSSSDTHEDRKHKSKGQVNNRQVDNGMREVISHGFFRKVPIDVNYLCSVVGKLAASVEPDETSHIPVDSLNWEAIAAHFPGYTAQECRFSWEESHAHHRFLRIPTGVFLYCACPGHESTPGKVCQLPSLQKGQVPVKVNMPLPGPMVSIASPSPKRQRVSKDRAEQNGNEIRYQINSSSLKTKRQVFNFSGSNHHSQNLSGFSGFNSSSNDESNSSSNEPCVGDSKPRFEGAARAEDKGDLDATTASSSKKGLEESTKFSRPSQTYQGTAVSVGSQSSKRKRKPARPWTEFERVEVEKMQKEFGNRWTLIAERLKTDRSGTEVKNFWHNRKQRLAMMFAKDGDE